MTTRRFYPAFAGKDGFEEKYVVMDGDTKTPVSDRMAYHAANDQADKRNNGEFIPEGMNAWLCALNFDLTPGNPNG